MIFNLFILQGYEESEVVYSNSVVWDIMNTCIIVNTALLAKF